MNKKNAKAWTCVLLGAESVGMMMAVVATIFSIVKLLDLSVKNENDWFYTNIFYLLAALVVLYGFVIRPMRRKAVEIFSSVIHFGKWTYFAELLSAGIFVLCGIFDCPLVSLMALGGYSAWKFIEISADTLLLNRHTFSNN